MAAPMPFGLKIALLNRAFHKKLDEEAAAMGLTAVQLRVLGSLSRLEASGAEEVHQNDLESIEHVTHPAMTKLLRRLQAKGFVECAPSVQDRRYKVVRCTQRSQGIHTLILEQDRRAMDALLGALSPDEQQQFVKMTDRLLEQIDQI
ncbi:MarR family winged helix-turn-helix transcriptional regulator [uncultured Ruthenibacterium sp.]|uniref:MarR family winged helix-turn-helix transcriptional regulator n=1 Tax=uncultured Ruthenibacterium sp. TaxID=1905347 RepID=UPI00349E7AD8